MGREADESVMDRARRVLAESAQVVYGLSSEMELPPAIIDYGPGSEGAATFELASAFTPQDGFQRAVADTDSDPVALIERGRLKHGRITFTPRALSKIKSMGVDLTEIARKAMKDQQIDPDAVRKARKPVQENNAVKVRPDANDVFKTLAEAQGGPALDEQTVVRAKATFKGEGTGMTRAEAVKVLTEAGFTPEQVKSLEVEARREAVVERYGLGECAGMGECDCRSKPDEAGRCVQPDGSKCRASHLRVREAMVKRDPFARQEVHRESAGQGECDWCGQKKRVYTYRVESDGGRKSDVKGKFCSNSCMRSYHDIDENTNGARQVAWYWPVTGVAKRDGLSEVDLAKIAAVLSNAPLPEDDNALRMKRIHAAAKQAIGRDIGEALATALSYAHRRQTQRSTLAEGRYAARKVGKMHAKSLVREAAGAEDISQTIVGGDGMKPKGGAKKVGQAGALTTVRESYATVNDACKRFPALGRGNTQIWIARDPAALKEGYEKAKASGALPDIRALHQTHVLLGTVRESNPDVLYAILQRGKWSPNGEATALMERKGLTRESLGVGDIIIGRTGAWFVDVKGFKPLNER